MAIKAIDWIDNRSQNDLIDKIFKKMGQNFDNFVKDTSEIPFGYAERSIVGQLAIAAHDNDCYTLQDYDVSIPKEEKTEQDKKKHYRPDLWIVTKDGKQDYVFEVKGEYIPFDVDEEGLKSRVSQMLDEAQDQLRRHGWDEGKYRCSIAALRLHCAPSKWTKYGLTVASFNNNINKLRKVIESIDWKDYDNSPNFYFLYMLPYDNVKKLCWKNDSGRECPPFLGLLCFGIKKNA